MVRAVRILLVSLVAALAACRSGIDEHRYRTWDARMAQWIQLAASAKQQVATEPRVVDRDQRVAGWDSVLQALVLARAAGATAYLRDDEAALAEIDRTLQALVERIPGLGRTR